MDRENILQVLEKLKTVHGLTEEQADAWAQVVELRRQHKETGTPNTANTAKAAAASKPQETPTIQDAGTAQEAPGTQRSAAQDAPGNQTDARYFFLLDGHPDYHATRTHTRITDEEALTLRFWFFHQRGMPHSTAEWIVRVMMQEGLKVDTGALEHFTRDDVAALHRHLTESNPNTLEFKGSKELATVILKLSLLFSDRRAGLYHCIILLVFLYVDSYVTVQYLTQIVNF
ncbi:hypothetical protein AJ79_05815 [Helicocarpus griseus UAMH5409]|uniref:Uncharacterized protein n=1 Tax=Helicocarpus griseus UAMH5409 TaxID=1447875 RepID=A0A2B7XJB9_9EURO|nr:hypothetical protein AJ79_05815 [Helicocarpus griseus UAMH5409]